jgi:hypothetical protein
MNVGRSASEKRKSSGWRWQQAADGSAGGADLPWPLASNAL